MRGPTHSASAIEPMPAEPTHHHGREPVAIAEAGGANRRSAADVRGQERREQQPGPS